MKQMITMSDKSRAVDAREIEEWMRERLWKPLKLSAPEHVDTVMSAEDLALDSMTVVQLAGELEQRLGIELEPSMIFEFESLAAYARQLEIMSRKARERRGVEGRPVAIALASTFTSEPVGEALTFGLTRLGFQPQVIFAPYHQVFQELLNPSGVMGSNRGGVNVVLVRVEDWFRFETAAVTTARAVAVVGEFLAAVRHFVGVVSSRLIVVMCPHTGAQVRRLGLSDALDSLDDQILSGVGGMTGVHALDLRDVENVGVRRVVDESRDRLGHIPYTAEYFHRLGLEVARRVFRELRPVLKVIAVDCDNTLWRGVCGEDGALGVEVTPAHAQFQEFLIRQQQSGRLICLLSKNNAEDVWEVFERNPGMKLRREHVVSARIDWQPKSANLLDVACELRLGLDSMTFIDDNPSECEEVGSAHPEVLVIAAPVEGQGFSEWLEGHWAFDVGQVTAEDAERTRLYRENLEREALRGTVRTFDDFIEQLQVRIEVTDVESADLARVAQLTQRTNQFNATTLRRSEAEIAALMARGVYVRAVRVSDRFGDYGLVGLMIAEADRATSALVCDTFLLSCRVLGKRVEQGMVEHLARVAADVGMTHLVLRFIPSPKNQPVRQFFESLGRPWYEGCLGECGGLSEAREIRVELDLLAESLARSRAEGARTGAVVNEASDGSKTAMGRQGQMRWAELAGGLRLLADIGKDSARLQAEIRSGNRIQRGELPTPYVAPRSAWQRKIAAIWAEVLGVDRVGIHDGFFELGGDSLRAAEVFARMWEIGAPESISLVNATEVTVAGVAGAIEQSKAGHAPELTTVRTSLDDEGKVPEDIQRAPGVVVLEEPMMRRVFLTGATGYLGAFLLAELMRQTEVSVECLVRAASPAEGKRRVASNLGRYGLWQETWGERIGVVLGDLAEPRFGLTETAFGALATRVDTVFHSGAWVNFVFPYERLRPSHVGAMETVLRLVTSDPLKVLNLHFISTLGVIMSTGYKRGVVVMEDERLQHVEGLLNGYEQAKHVADRMAWTGMRERGIPTAIYRPGMVGGIGTTGEYHKLDEFLSSFYKGCIQLGAMPLLESTWEVVPVDFLTRVIVHGATRRGTLNHTYHSLHSTPTLVADYIRWFNEMGYPMRALPWGIWKRELLAQGVDRVKRSALFPFVDFIRALTDEQVYFPATDKTNWMRLVQSSGQECPEQREVLERYLAHFARVGYVPAGRVGTPSVLGLSVGMMA